MKLTIKRQDLFAVPKDYFLCHCISADFALGAGIAKKFAVMGVKDRLMQTYECKWHGNGYVIATHETSWRGEYNLVTKEKFWQKPTLQTLRQALTNMKIFGENNDKIAMPKIGCGLDRLNWQEVEQIIREVFADSDVEILVCDWS